MRKIPPPPRIRSHLGGLILQILIFAVAGHRLYAGVTDEFRVEVFSLTGERMGSISDEVARTPLSRRLMDEFLATRPEEHRAAWAAREYPEHLPAFSHLLVDDEGNLWR